MLRHASIEAPLDAATIAGLAEPFAELAADAREELAAQGVPAADVALERRLLVKVAGSDTSLRIAWDESSSAADANGRVSLRARAIFRLSTEL